MAINLGDISFGLVADTKGLQTAITRLRGLSRQVNAAAASQVEGAQRAAQALHRQERALASTIIKARSLEVAVKNFGQQAAHIYPQLSRYVVNYADAVSGAQVDSIAFGRAQTYISAKLGEVNNALKKTQANIRLQATAENNLARARERLANLESRVTRAGAPSSTIGGARAALVEYERVLKQSNLTQEQLTAATRAFNAAVGDSTRQLSEYSSMQRMVDQNARRLERTQNQLRSTLARGTAAGLDPDMRRGLLRSYAVYSRAVQGGADQGTQNAAFLAYQNNLRGVNRVLDEAQNRTNRFTGAIRNLERASILAVGPLSGIGARVAVIASLMEGGTVKGTLLIATLAGLAAAFGYLGVKLVQAGMQFERTTALMTAAVGLPAMAAQEYDYIASTALRLGQSINELAPAYARFATAARFSGMALEEVHTMYEQVMTAATGLRLSTAETSRMFKAFQDMISKGNIQAEELKQQLGDVLPGALSIMAAAIGKSEKELLKMSERGELLASRDLPKLAQALAALYGDAATAGMASLNAEVGRTSTEFSLFLIELNKATGLTDAFKGVLQTLNSGMDFLRRNVTSLVGALGTLAAVMATGITVRLISWIGTLGVATVGTKALTVATFGLSGALMGLKTAHPIVAILSLIGAVISGAAAFKAMKSSAEEAMRSVDTTVQDADRYLEMAEKYNLSQHSMTITTFQQVEKRIAAIQEEIKLQEKLHDDLFKEWKEGDSIFRIADPVRSLFGMETTADKAEKIKGRIKELGEEASKAQQQLLRLSDQALADYIKMQGQNADETKEKAESLFERVKDKVEELKGEQAALKAIQESNAQGARYARAAAEAAKMLNNTKLQQGELAKIQELLSKGQFKGNSLNEQLADLVFQLDSTKTSADDALKRLERLPQVLGDAGSKMRELYDSIAESEGNPLLSKRLLSMGKSVEDFRESLLEVVGPGALSYKGVEELTDRFKDLLQAMHDIQDVAKAKSTREGIVSSILGLQGKTFEAHTMELQKQVTEWEHLIELLRNSPSAEVQAMANSLTEVVEQYTELSRQRATFDIVTDATEAAEAYYRMAQQYREASIAAAEANLEMTSGEAIKARIASTEELRDQIQGLIQTYKWLAASAQNAGDAMEMERKIKILETQLKELSGAVETVSIQFSKTFGNEYFQALDSVMTGTKTWSEAFTDFWRNVALEIGRIFTRSLAEQVAKGMKLSLDQIKMGASGGGSGWLGAIGSFLGFAGTTQSSTGGYSYASPEALNVPARMRRAGGGHVTKGHRYLVGDGGEPEIFEPGVSGNITPISKLGGKQTAVVNQYITIQGQYDDVALRGIMSQAAEVARAEIYEMMRRYNDSI